MQEHDSTQVTVEPSQGRAHNWAYWTALCLAILCGLALAFPCAVPILPFPASNTLLLLASVLSVPLLAFTTSHFFGPVSFRQAAALLISTVLCFLTMTDIGILLIGHRLWVTTADAGDASHATCRLRVVVDSTEYGNNVLERDIRTWVVPERRVFLLKAATRATDNASWKARFRATADEILRSPDDIRSTLPEESSE